VCFTSPDWRSIAATVRRHSLIADPLVGEAEMRVDADHLQAVLAHVGMGRAGRRGRELSAPASSTSTATTRTTITVPFGDGFRDS